jgi:hypothetical protein
VTDPEGRPADVARDPSDSANPLAQLVAPPIFVVGQHRSGTTWIFDLLTHPDDVAGVFESLLFTRDLGIGGVLHWGHWDEKQVATVKGITGRHTGIGQLVDKEEVREVFRTLAQRWLARALKPSDRYLVEKSPSHLHSALEILSVFPDARFVHVIRDGRDVAVSTQAARNWAPGAMRKQAMSVLNVARQWERAMVTSENLVGYLDPSQVVEISYERMHAEPKAVATELFRFCGFEGGEDAVDAAIAATRFDANYSGGDDQFRRAGRTGDWRSSLSLLDRLAFERGAGDMLRKRGYERSRWWWIRPSGRT